jgi:glycosyltransferase involved in cell wall biosynthesis
MDVLQVNKFFFQKGGTERYFFSLSDALSERGHSVIHFAMKHPDNLASPFSEYFVEERDFYRNYSLSEKAALGVSFIRSRKAAACMRRLLAAYHPRIAHLHNIYHQITPSIIPVLREAGVPIVMTLHDYKLVCPNYSMFAKGEYCYKCMGGRYFNAPLTCCNDDSFLRSLLIAIEAYWQSLTGVYRCVRYFIAPSKFIRERFIEAGFDEAKVVHIPSFMPALEQEKDGGERGEGRLSNLPEKYILYFGRLSREKGIYTVIEAIEKLGGVPLVLCGGGPLQDELQTYTLDHKLENVHFTGHLSQDLLAQAIKNAYAVVLPSLSPENAPLSLLEAAAMGKPVIASSVGGLPEIIDQVGGRLFRPGSSEDLAREIRELWEDEKGAAALGQGSAEAARRGFDKNEHVEKIEELYGRALS